jgi:potassium voltage-gated channel Eag-related subfamily H protein 5
MPVIAYIDFAINGIYFLDILVSFRTTYYNNDGEEIYDPLMIAINYFKTLFVFDVLVCIPFNYFIWTDTDIMKIVSILKITRFPRLMKMINRLEMRDDSKAIFGILVMTIYLFVYIHIVTCLWYYLISID